MRKLCAPGVGVMIDPVSPEVVDWVVGQAAGIQPRVAKEWHRIFGRTSAMLQEMPARVKAPVLLVAGENHVHGCQPPLLENLRKKIPDARAVHYVPGVAIGVQLLAAEACAKKYLEFLESVGDAA